MTDKEIAKKVWYLVDMYGDEFGVTVLVKELEKILPRPKRKVKKTSKVWVVSYWHSEDHHVAVAGTYRSEGAARAGVENDGFVQEIELSAEVEE